MCKTGFRIIGGSCIEGTYIYISQDTKKAKSVPRNELLIPPIKKDEEVISYVSTNNTEMFSILKKNLHFLTSDQTMRDALSGHYEKHAYSVIQQNFTSKN